MANDNNLFTSKLKQEDLTNLSLEIQSSIRNLQDLYPNQEINALRWNDNFIAIPMVVEVDLPTRGPVYDISILKHEPIYLLLHRKYYPFKAPLAYSNRRDFPANQLPHINPTAQGRAAWFCLHRGDFNNWFAEHSIVDVVQRIRGWLRDAARDRLIRREDGFEVTRLESQLGINVYDPSSLIEFVNQRWTDSGGKADYAFLWYELMQEPKEDPLIGADTYAIKLVRLIYLDIDELQKLALYINGIYKEHKSLKPILFGVLAWPSKNVVFNRYFVDLPERLAEFQDWAEEYGIPLKDALKDYLKKDLIMFGGIPVTTIIPRPQKLIGRETNLELLNFVVNVADVHAPRDNEWNLEARVHAMGHRAPLTVRRAREISSKEPNRSLGRLLWLGCGAIGSKMVFHLARSGQVEMTLVDYDELSPHNLVRHALQYDSLGDNKADGIKKGIEEMFYADNDNVRIEVEKISALDILIGDNKHLLDDNEWLVDTTASAMIHNALNQIDLPETISCCRCELAHNGMLGFLRIEGPERNPRLDDMQVKIFDLAVDNPIISAWLVDNQRKRQEVGSVLEDINIGLSCNSETMRLSDEIVSLHASHFSIGFRKHAEYKDKRICGYLQVNHYSDSGDLLSVSEQIKLFPGTILNARNDAEWQLRLGHGIEKELKHLLNDAKPNETGGILIGQINLKRKIIYVTRALPAPPDSKSSPYAFVRGVQDIPEEVFRIQGVTGGMLGYVGEWHTHPKGDPTLSQDDEGAVIKIKKNLDKIPLPTHILIVTNRGLYPYIFDPRRKKKDYGFV